MEGNPNDFGNDVVEDIVDHHPEIIVENEDDVAVESHPDSEVDLEEAPIIKEQEKEKPKPKTRAPADKRIHEIQKEKYQALDELQKLREENEQLRKMADLSTQSAIINYDMTVKQRLERAKQLKTQAIESGDVNAQIEADVELSSAVGEMQKANDWKLQKSYQDQQINETYQQPPEVINQKEINRWVNENAWLSPNNEDYDEELANKMNVVTDSLDSHLFRTGQAHLRFTREYFNELDAYKRQLLSESEAPPESNRSNQGHQFSQRRSAPVRTSNRPPVSPVRGQRNSSIQEDRPRYTISNEERDMAQRMGVSDKAYVYEREMQIRNRPDQRYTGGR